MARQNRVTPLGELIVTPARGLVYGNRGCLHDAEHRIRRSFNGRRWIACQLEFEGWHRSPLMAPGRFTELFFLDEATALAAGHRPCARCRRQDYDRFRQIWARVHGAAAGADAIDAQLHHERLLEGAGERRLHGLAVDALPDGAMILWDGAPRIVLGHQLLAWTPAGYEQPVARPTSGNAQVITPPSLLAVLRTNWAPAVPLLHPTAVSS